MVPLLLICVLAPTTLSSFSGDWSIDYANPKRYLLPGNQSRISSDQAVAMLKTKLGVRKGLVGLRDLFLWMKQEFSTYDGGGRTIGKMTIDQLLALKSMSGCHDFGLAFSAVARYLDYPTIIVDAAGISWAEQHKAGMASGYSGHVFVEVYVDSRWILVDSTTGEFMRDYQVTNPMIPIKKRTIEEKGYCAILKGTDTWSYGVTDPTSLHRKMEAFAISLDLNKLATPTYVIERLSSLVDITAITFSEPTTTSLAPLTTTSVSTEMLPQSQANWLYPAILLVITVFSAGILLHRKISRQPSHIG